MPRILAGMGLVRLQDLVTAGRTYFPLDAPPEEPGQEKRPKADLKMQTRGSRFVRFQEMKLQERAIEVRTLTATQG